MLFHEKNQHATHNITAVWAIAKPNNLHSFLLNPLLNSAEQKQAKRFKNEAHGQWWAYVRCAMKSILSEQLGCSVQELIFSYTDTKKPYLANKESANIHFNLSHCDNAALLVISNYAEVGIDIESLKPISDMHAVVKHFFSLAEQDYFAQSERNQQCEKFYEIWTQKESLIKANGGGLHLPLSDFDVVGVNADTWRTIEPNTDVFKDTRYALRQLTLEEFGLSSTHKAALCFALSALNSSEVDSVDTVLPVVQFYRYIFT